MPSKIGELVVLLPTGASPGAQPAGGFTVPGGANLVLAFLGGNNDAGVTLTSLASNFTTANFVVSSHPGFTGYGAQFGVAQINSSGAGKTITPVWSAGITYGPNCTLVFCNVTDPAAVIADLTSEGATGRLFMDGSSGTTPVSGTVNSTVTDLVFNYDVKYTTSSVIPGTPSGYTSVITQADLGGSTTRLSLANSPGASTTNGTTVDTDYSALVMAAVRDAGGGGDVTAPVLTSPTSASTGTTTGQGTVTTDEANGTMYSVVSTSSTPPSVAQIQAGQMHTGASAAWAGNQSISSTGVKTFNSTGLTNTTTYYYHFQHKDAAGNDSLVSTSTAFTTDTPGDVTPPVLTSGNGTVETNSLIVIGATTDESNGTMYAVLTTSATPPTGSQIALGQNNLGVAAAWSGSLAISSTGAKTLNAMGPAANTAYYPYIVHRDAAGNYSNVISVGSRTTFRNGATGQDVLDDTGPVDGNVSGIMYEFVAGGQEADWFSYEITTPNAAGTLTTYPNGTYTFVGSAPDSFVATVYRDATNIGTYTAYLYQSAPSPTRRRIVFFG